MDIYTVTVSLMDQSVDANPFWHAYIFLSRYDNATRKMEVIERLGFGGVTTTNQNPSIRKIKRNLGLDTDFYGNHGMFYQEDIRRMERGYGLHGVTFELTKENFFRLQSKCHQMVIDQNAAIEEAISAFKKNKSDLEESVSSPAPSPHPTRFYPYENISLEIFQYELAQAVVQNRSSRLKGFSVLPFPDKLTCKVHILALLEGILTTQQLERVKGLHSAIPRTSGKMEDIYLHSRGPLFEHKKRSGEVVHYRKNNTGEKLYWTVLPQEFEALSEKTAALFKMHEDRRFQVKTVISQLQQLEWFFTDVMTAEIYEPLREKLLNHIASLYELFAIVEPKRSAMPKNDWYNFWKSLALQPRDADEKILLDNLSHAKTFINNIYMAMMDGFSMYIVDPVNQVETNIDPLIASLSEKEKNNFCKIVRRNYLSPESFKSSWDDESLSAVAKMFCQ